MSATQTRRLPTVEQITRRRRRINSTWTSRERSQRAQQANAAMKTLWTMIARPAQVADVQAS